MKKLILSTVAAVILTGAGGILTLGVSGVASAAGTPPWQPEASSVGTILFFNASGQQITGGKLTDSPIAAYVEGTVAPRAGDTKATLLGYLPVNGQAPGSWSGDQLSSSTTYPNTSAPGALASSTLPVVTGASGDESVAQLAANYPNTDTSSDGYAGIYELRLKTTGAGLGQTTTYDSVDIAISGTGASATWSVDYPTPTLNATSTVLTASPTSPQTAGTSVTLTATVSPSVSGTVQFENAGVALGAPVTVSGGTAQLSTSTLPVGTDSLSAVFTPAINLAYSGSTGTASYTINPAPAAGTTTALSVNPLSAAAYTSVGITANVTNTATSAALAAGAGTIKFYDDGTDSTGDVTSNSVLLGTQSLASGGSATLNYSTFAVGSHNLVAVFTPADPASYNSSTSSAVAFTATTPAVTPAVGSIDTSIPVGGLTISTPYSSANPFNLGTATLNSTATAFVASAAFGSPSNPSQGVTITDARAGDLAWTATATVTDFSNGTGGVINGQNLTLTNVAPSYISGNALQAGSVSTSSVTNTSVYSATAAGSDGLRGGPHQFASASSGAGSVYIDGVLTLTSPTSTPPGSYVATLTLTVS